ncbi:MAG: shikimate dehydrogenase [Candidatus Hadarchaeales archaeon]
MISSKTKVFALIGDPVEGSLSPPMHNAAFRHLGLDCVYVALRVPSSMLKEALLGVRAMGIGGLNVTFPHKTAILPLLDELDPSAEEVGAVNTVKNEGGKLKGFNTDGEGAVRFLRERLGSLKGRRVVLLGAGGAARALAFSLLKEGVELTLLNRTVSKAEGLASELRKKGGEVKWGGLERAELREALRSADVLINATPVGMDQRGGTLVTHELMHPELFVMDLVYHPPETELMKEAKRAGAKAENGLGMLLYQAALSFRIFTGKRAPLEVMRRALRRGMGS